MHLPGLSPDELELEVVEGVTQGPGHGDLALSVRVVTPSCSFRGEPFWVETAQVSAFLAEFAALARTRSGRASLHFLGPARLTFFSLAGTADLAVHGRFTSYRRVGPVTLPTTLDVHTSLDSEFVERAWGELRHLLRGPS